MIDLTDANSENVVFHTDFRSVLNSLSGHGEHNLRRKLYSILEHRRVVIQWIPAHCGIKGNEHAEGLAKQGANMEQEKLLITLRYSSIPTSQATYMVRRNIITPEAVWEERSTREDSWLHSAGWLIRVIKRTRRRSLILLLNYYLIIFIRT